MRERRVRSIFKVVIARDGSSISSIRATVGLCFATSRIALGADGIEMNNMDWDGLDPARSKLRALSQRMSRGVAALGTDPQAGALNSEKAALIEAWRELSAALALEGEEPLLRPCPHCRRRILAQATRCRYCMRRSAARVLA